MNTEKDILWIAEQEQMIEIERETSYEEFGWAVLPWDPSPIDAMIAAEWTL